MLVHYAFLLLLISVTALHDMQQGVNRNDYVRSSNRRILAQLSNNSETGPEQPRLQSTKRALLRVSDLKYSGSFGLPKKACNWTTMYSSGGLALRHVGGKLRFLSTVHVYSGSLVYEVEFPGLSFSKGSWPTATVAQEFCDIYQGRRRLGDSPEDLDGRAWVHGISYDADQERLYWNYGEIYNADASNDHIFGYTKLNGNKIVARGPWRTTSSSEIHSQMVRGGTLTIPKWFADQYLGGRQLGLGFGGYYNIIGRGSMGPVLTALNYPDNNADGDTINPLELLGHPAVIEYGNRYAWRPTNYWIDDIYWAKGPTNGRGYWAPGDSIEGAGVWIDTGTHHGLFFFPQLNTGRIAYENGGIQSEGTKSYAYVYDPVDLAKVAAKKKKTWQVNPKEMVAMEYRATGEPFGADTGAMRRISGAAYDAQGGILYLLQLHARVVDGGSGQYHLVHAYKISPSTK